jgi:hypothetical protein
MRAATATPLRLHHPTQQLAAFDDRDAARALARLTLDCRGDRERDNDPLCVRHIFCAMTDRDLDAARAAGPSSEAC